eukprot:CAMPEP_0201544330 /NCGR_PEP_ID=MMETSP0173_2-20130828/936_1 /ASSEMBLY_ACC=CAM_ASM_000268 /TAXON_ID=218659 /ORGANISM="Vexillifera sp., Strain DIVA3 564/2" /LENGTH=402 /DNA_ID=CAMNT_0047952407 /DNA_START=302 /DNA_END=1508 /DNA_ORIENTATION=-
MGCDVAGEVDRVVEHEKTCPFRQAYSMFQSLSNRIGALEKQNQVLHTMVQNDDLNSNAIAFVLQNGSSSGSFPFRSLKTKNVTLCSNLADSLPWNSNFHLISPSAWGFGISLSKYKCTILPRPPPSRQDLSQWDQSVQSYPNHWLKQANLLVYHDLCAARQSFPKSNSQPNYNRFEHVQQVHFHPVFLQTCQKDCETLRQNLMTQEWRYIDLEFAKKNRTRLIDDITASTGKVPPTSVSEYLRGQQQQQKRHRTTNAPIGYVQCFQTMQLTQEEAQLRAVLFLIEDHTTTPTLYQNGWIPLITVTLVNQHQEWLCCYRDKEMYWRINSIAKPQIGFTFMVSDFKLFLGLFPQNPLQHRQVQLFSGTEELFSAELHRIGAKSQLKMIKAYNNSDMTRHVDTAN